MAVRTDPRFGYVYGWASGDDGWGADMNTNLELLMWLQHQKVLDTDLATPPGSPTVGDVYIPAPTATSDWASHEGDLAIYWQGPSDASAEWKFFALDADMEGVALWLADENEWIVWTGSAWEKKSEWDKFLSKLNILDTDLATPPGSPSVGDAYIPSPTATGAWASHEGEVAVWWQEPGAAAAWKFFAPGSSDEGFEAWLADENEWIVWTGSAWEKKGEWDKLVSRLSVIDRDLTAPPGSPTLKDIYIPAATATGAWAGHEDDIAVWWQEPGAAAAWKFETPPTGLRAYIEDEVVLTVFDGTNWRTGNAVT